LLIVATVALFTQPATRADGTPQCDVAGTIVGGTVTGALGGRGGVAIASGAVAGVAAKELCNGMTDVLKSAIAKSNNSAPSAPAPSAPAPSAPAPSAPAPAAPAPAAHPASAASHEHEGGGMHMGHETGHSGQQGFDHADHNFEHGCKDA
jgi:hypothetical protein